MLVPMPPARCDVQDLQREQRRSDYDQLPRLECGSKRPSGGQVPLTLLAKPLQDDRCIENRFGHRASRSARTARVDSSAGLRSKSASRRARAFRTAGVAPGPDTRAASRSASCARYALRERPRDLAMRSIRAKSASSRETSTLPTSLGYPLYLGGQGLTATQRRPSACAARSSSAAAMRRSARARATSPRSRRSSAARYASAAATARSAAEISRRIASAESPGGSSRRSDDASSRSARMYAPMRRYAAETVRGGGGAATRG